MDLAAAIQRLHADADVFRAQVEGVTDDQARWKPDETQWSILEVVAHLADEEVLDFRTRVDLTLHRPAEAWPRIDPERWVTERAYNALDLPATLERFVDERARSVAWLRGLSESDWTVAHEHPRFGPIRAGDLLGSWVAHDLIHVRQINRLHRAWLEHAVAPGFALAYAGRW